MDCNFFYECKTLKLWVIDTHCTIKVYALIACKEIKVIWLLVLNIICTGVEYLQNTNITFMFSKGCLSKWIFITAGVYTGPCFNNLPKETNYKTAKGLLMCVRLKYSMFFLVIFSKQKFILSTFSTQRKQIISIIMALEHRQAALNNHGIINTVCVYTPTTHKPKSNLDVTLFLVHIQS